MTCEEVRKLLDVENAARADAAQHAGSIVWWLSARHAEQIVIDLDAAGQAAAASKPHESSEREPTI